MYKVVKEKGHNTTVSVENTDAHTSIDIGRLTMDIIDKLEKAGHKIGDGGISMTDEWSLAVDEGTAKELAAKAMSMKKPVRDQSKKPKSLFKKPNKEIDAMDVLLGLAKYN